MPGRILIAGAPGDVVLEWLVGCAKQHGFEPAVVSPDAGDGAPIALTPIVAGFDLWRTSGEPRFEAIAGLDERLPPGRPLLSLCNALSADEAASYAVRADRVVGFSIFGPPHEGMLVEVLPGLGSAVAAAQRSADVLMGLGLQTITLPPGSWAVLPRVLSMVVNEAAVAVAEGVATAAEIDVAMTLGASYPQGPLALADEVGLGEILATLEALHAEYGDDRYRPAPLLRRLVLAGYTGKAAGRGFHLYP